MPAKPAMIKTYSVPEEIANSVSHGLGCLFSIIGCCLLIFKAHAAAAPVSTFVSYALYGASLIILFLASTLYHAVTRVQLKQWLKKIDHCAIYLLIAGTYTPFLIVALQSKLGYGLMAVIWILAVIGVIFKLFFTHRFRLFSVVTYLLMGWLSLIVIWQLASRLPLASVVLLAFGGVTYSLGVIFYVAGRIPYNHAIWHGFVLGGAVCHFCAIYFYVQ